MAACSWQVDASAAAFGGVLLALGTRAQPHPASGADPGASTADLAGPEPAPCGRVAWPASGKDGMTRRWRDWQLTHAWLCCRGNPSPAGGLLAQDGVWLPATAPAAPRHVLPPLRCPAPSRPALPRVASRPRPRGPPAGPRGPGGASTACGLNESWAWPPPAGATRRRAPKGRLGLCVTGQKMMSVCDQTDIIQLYLVCRLWVPRARDATHRCCCVATNTVL